MELYIFQGVVLPERAQLSIQLPPLVFSHNISGAICAVKVSIILNQVVIWVESDVEWDIFDLKNIVKDVVRSYVNMVGYMLGRAYDLEITRVINQSGNIDYVFGIDIPCLAEWGKSLDLNIELKKLSDIATGPNGVYIRRCFNDLVSAMKDAEDTGFYCYRAIESLRHHCAAVHGLIYSSENSKWWDKKSWEKFREIAACDRSNIDYIKKVADALRHGAPVEITSEYRDSLFIKAWNIVDGYLQNIIMPADSQIP